MSTWRPLPIPTSPSGSEFSGLMMKFSELPFQPLCDVFGKDMSGKRELATKLEAEASQEEQLQTGCTVDKGLDQQALIARQEAEISRLNAEIHDMKKVHSEEIKSTAEEIAGNIAKALHEQHEAALADLGGKLAFETAEVLRPILGEAATRAAEKEFRGLISDIAADQTIATVTLEISDPYFDAFRKNLPANFKVVRTPSNHPMFEIRFDDKVIASRLGQWSQKIFGDAEK